MSHPRLFRTYQVKANPSYNCMIWEAARATAAIPRFFKSISIGKGALREEFLGANLGYNNPVDFVLKEAESLFGASQNVACVVSIGAGHPQTISWQPPSGASKQLFSDDLVTLLKQICTDCEQTSDQLAQRLKNTENIYFRLRVEQGMQPVSLEDWRMLGEIKTHTTQYLHLQRITQEIDHITSVLIQSPKGITIGELSMYIIYGEMFILTFFARWPCSKNTA